jgi:hypothetical protein
VLRRSTRQPPHSDLDPLSIALTGGKMVRIACFRAEVATPSVLTNFVENSPVKSMANLRS